MEFKKIKIKTVIVSLCFVLGIEVIFGVAALKSTILSPILAIGIVRLIEIIILFLVVTQFEGGIASIGLDPQHWFHGLKKGLIWSAVFGLCVAIVFAALYAFHINPLQILGSGLSFNGKALILFFSIGGLIGPVAEEMFFRGIIYGFLRRWGILIAMIGTTIIFSVAHLKGTPFPLTQIVGGILFSIAYEVEKNLFTPITIHVLGNLAIFSIPLVF